MKDDATGFYQELAPYYDQMTRFGERYYGEQKLLKDWAEHYQFNSALDVACGTGLHTIILSALGIRVVGTDISQEMLNQAGLNASAAGENVSWLCSSMQDISRKTSQKFDAIFCLGNSLPHLLTAKDLQTTIQGFLQILNDPGILVIQMLNYDQILKDKKRIIGINREKNREFIRFYDFLENMLRFNILTVDWNENQPSPRLTSTLLYPYTQSEIDKILKQHGFSRIEYFGNLSFSKYDGNKSPNLVVVGRKNDKYEEY